MLPIYSSDGVEFTAHQIAAARRFIRVFPHGCERIPTSGAGLLCGFHAIINTMSFMQLPVAPPTVEELQEIYDSEEMKEINAIVLMDNDSNFTVDQVGATLFRWGESRGLNLQLGCTSAEAKIQMISHPNDEPTIAVFIKHEDLGLIGHYSGLKAKEWGEQTAEEFAEEQTSEEDSSDAKTPEDSSSDQEQHYKVGGSYQAVNQDDNEVPDADGYDEFEQEYWNQDKAEEPEYSDRDREMDDIEEIEDRYWNEQFERF